MPGEHVYFITKEQPTSSFVIGLAFAWNDGTTTFLGGFSLSLPQSDVSLMHKRIIGNKGHTTQNDDLHQSYLLDHQARS